MANEPLLSWAFFAGYRPWTLPLFYKALPASDAWQVGGAVAVSVICWSVLALVAASLMHHERMRWLALLGVLGFSLTYPVIRWDPLLLSESVSLSLTAMVVAAWLRFGRSRSAGCAAWVVGAMVAWIFVRDTHAYVALVIAAAVVVVAWRSSPRILTFAVAAMITLASVLAIASTSTDDARPRRLDRPLLHVIGGRIIPDPDAAAWFQQEGMPLTPEIRALAPTLGFAAAPEPDARTRPFYRWARADGRATYMRYLLAHPLSSAQAVVDSHEEVLGPIEGYDTPGLRTILPRPGEGSTFVPRSLIAFALLLVAAGVAARHRRHLSRPLVLVTSVGLLAQLPYVALVVHGDTIELGRHAAGISITTKLLIMLLSLAVLDALVSSRRTPATPSSDDDRQPQPI